MAPGLPPLEDASLEEAQAAFLAVVAPLEGMTVPLADAQGYALAASLRAPFSLPSYDNSAMDGYAFRAADVAGASPERPIVLCVVGEAAAGHAFPGTVATGQAVRVMTGAPLPTGADAILPEEEAMLRADRLRLEHPASAGRHVRRAGEDVAAGAPVLEAGVALGPAELALLAALGCSQVGVVRRPRVAVLTTGDELRLPGEACGEGGVYNANLFALCAQIREAGAEPVPLPAAADDAKAIDQALTAALHADAVVTSAGMCAGQHDHVAATLRGRGNFVAGCLRLRPARHVGLGLVDRKPVFALPGNPAASLIAFELLVRPPIMRMAGRRSWRRPLLQATLAEPVRSARGVTQAIWLRLHWANGGYRARPAGSQGAGMLSTAARANGLLVVPEDVTGYAAGDRVAVQLLAAALPPTDELRELAGPAAEGPPHS
jgi:molybdopterin molybdotransferase